MKKLAVAVLLLLPALLSAQVRTFVSSATGVDNANCGIIDPCRTFTAAIAAVLSGGEVVVLDTGGYGPAVINKSVVLAAPAGVHASIAATTGNSLHIIGDPLANVTIRNLHFTALGAFTGIFAEDFKTLFIDRCVVSHAASGIFISPNADGARVSIADTTVRSSIDIGILLRGDEGILHAFMLRVHALANESGIFTSRQTRSLCIDCQSHGNDFSGFAAAGGAPGELTELLCDGCVASRNGNGFNVLANFEGGPSRIRLARSVAVANRLAGVASTLNSEIHVLAGTNMIADNGNSNNGPIIVIPGDNP